MLFISIANSQDNDTYHFSKNVDDLSECLENYGIDRSISNSAAKVFSGKSTTREDISQEVFTLLVDRGFDYSSNTRLFWTNFQTHIEKVIEDCSDNNRLSDNTSNRG